MPEEHWNSTYFILPLLGGYFFYFSFHGTEYYARRCSGQRLLFNSAIAGVALLITARLMSLLVERLDQGSDLVAFRLGVGMVSLLSLSLVTITYLGYRFLREKPFLGRDSIDAGKALAGVLVGIVLVRTILGVTVNLHADAWLIQNVLGVSVILLALLWPLVNILQVHTRAPPQSLIFRIVLLVTAVALAFIAAIGYQHEIHALWDEFSPYPQSGTALLAFILGLVIVPPLNRLLFPYDVAIDRLYMNSRINSFERLIYESTLEQSQVQITLRDGKVYVGWVQDMPPKLHESDTYLEILPVSSGYRDSTTKEYVPKTFYARVYEQYAEAENPSELGIDLKDFTKVIPISEIVIAGKFSQDAYVRFLEQGELAVPEAASTDTPTAADVPGSDGEGAAATVS